MNSSQWDMLQEKYQNENAEVKSIILKRLHAVVLASGKSKLPDSFRISINFRSRKVDIEELDMDLSSVLKDLRYEKEHICSYSQKRNTYKIDISKPLKKH